MTFLRLDRQGRDRPRVEAPEGNRFAGLLTKAIGAVFEPPKRRIDFRDQFALAIAGPQFELPLRLCRRAIRKIGEGRCFGLKVLDRFAAFAEDFLLPAHELAAKILTLRFAHEGFAFRRPVAGRKFHSHAEHPFEISCPG